MLHACHREALPRQVAFVTRGIMGSRSQVASRLFVLACLSYSSSPAISLAAQPDEKPAMARLLFEPLPLPPANATPAENFVSFDSVLRAPRTDSAALAIRTDTAADDADALRESIAMYVARIGDKEATEGPYSDQLTQDLLSVGQLHQRAGEHAQAIDFFTRAQNISRANHGMEDIDQAPIMEAMTRSYVALERYVEADATQEGLLYLYRKVYGETSPEVAAALHRLGEWNLDAFLARSNVMLNIRRINMANFFATTGYTVNTSGSNVNRSADTGIYVQEENPTHTPLFKLYLAQVNFENAINLLLQTKDYANPELLELERKLVTTLFLHTHQENIVYEPDFYLNRSSKATGTRIDTSTQNLLNSPDYLPGVEALQRSLSYIVNNEQRTAEQVARAMLEAGDWELLFMRSRRADERYAEAHRFFAANPDVTATIDDIVYPQVPVVLPVFLPAPNSREKLGIAANEDVNYFGYFDVEFAIGKNGRARRVKFLDAGGNVTPDMKLRLGDYLKNLVFRPRYVAGEYDGSVLQLRYYVGY